MITLETNKNDTKRDYEKKVQAYVDEIDAEIMKAEMRYREVSDEAKQQISTKLHELKDQRSEIETEYNNLIKSADSNWKEVKEALENKTDQVNAAVEGVIDGLDYAAKKMN